jgi:hypothetical protein
MLRIVPVPLGPADSTFQGWELLWEIRDLPGGEQLVQPADPRDGDDHPDETSS